MRNESAGSTNQLKPTKEFLVPKICKSKTSKEHQSEKDKVKDKVKEKVKDKVKGKKKQKIIRRRPPVTRPWASELPVVQARLANMPNYLVEKSHGLHLLRSLTKRKQSGDNWPFRRSELWPSYCQNPRYDHAGTEPLDWQILEQKLCSNSFDGFDDFTRAVQKMFNNSLRCFPRDRNLFASVNATNALFKTRVDDYKQSMQDVKKEIQDIAAWRIQTLKFHISEQMRLEKKSSQKK